ncbi:MAG: hypothetical protein ACI92S_003594, partial [Planctomycetaceae bacterium]
LDAEDETVEPSTNVDAISETRQASVGYDKRSAGITQ